MMKGSENSKGETLSFDLDENMNEVLSALYPLPSLKQLALCYHMIMETNDSTINIANCRRFFQLELKNYEEIDMQRFNLTCCSCDQVISSFNNPIVEESMDSYAAIMLQQFIDNPENMLLRINIDNELSEADIKMKVDAFLSESLNGLTKKENLVVGSIIICGETSTRYIYIFNIDMSSRVFKVYRTKGKKPIDEDILASFQAHSEKIGFETVLYEDIPRNSLINNYPDILLAFIVQRMMLETSPFEVALHQLTFNLLPFICEEGEVTGENTENNGGTREQFEDDEFEEVGYNEEEGYQKEPKQPRQGKQDESEDIDFDDDDFDDIVDDF